ncbi:MAG TPA: glycoside hydrolase family 43 protein [Acidimicrobiales bacterium]|nr:glycoside hydrolase family 43 protein [Acidimicrobiales bacterium]
MGGSAVVTTRRGPGALRRRGIGALVVLLAAFAAGLVPHAGAEGVTDFPDPFVLPVDGGYIAVGTSPAGSPIKIPLRKSTDLRDWSQPVEALARVAAWARPASAWAPSISSPSPGQWRLYYAIPHAVTRLRCISVATSVSPDGPFIDRSAIPLVCDDRRGGAIDPEVFNDDEGRHWLLWKTEGLDDATEAALWSRQLDADGTDFIGEPHPLLERSRNWERPLIENPSMVAHDGRLLLFYSAGVWQNETYKVGVARCHSPAGPCERLFDHPILSSRPGIAGPGGASAFHDRSGRLRLAFHAWSSDRLGYQAGGARSLHIGAVMGQSLAVGANPVGALDDFSWVGPTAARVRGWGADLDGHAPIDIHLYVDGRGVGSIRAAGLRPDVEAANPGLGAYRGWEALVEVPPGARQLCAYGINVGLGANTLLGCRQVR